MAIMFGKFSEDMVVQMMSRLPPKSLMRFRCFNKSWNNLMSSPSLVAKHLSNSKLNASSTTCIIFKRLVILEDETTRIDVDEVFLCNPATREFRILPKPYLPPILYVSETSECLASGLPKTSEILDAGFGYDDKAKVHKVVRVKFVLALPDLNMIYSRAEVYTSDAVMLILGERLSVIHKKLIFSHMFSRRT
ncbi:PREDICTED: F-box/kelch-repeat [Prunus dulcis]|uniref:PREDICTED: F-box/kelch-repeat n=1 Tax=Prunus dulcis TaxID=3755 RepID=A0A5E4ECF1_PRUDU|nr:PREDICTED: F-box/kelch-repeat [Prunus dulcis]VVA12620.1 PREDICTED: F-box/kelch-repeat [Prunus dulcis]